MPLGKLGVYFAFFFSLDRYAIETLIGYLGLPFSTAPILVDWVVFYNDLSYLAILMCMCFFARLAMKFPCPTNRISQDFGTLALLTFMPAEVRTRSGSFFPGVSGLCYAPARILKVR